MKVQPLALFDQDTADAAAADERRRLERRADRRERDAEGAVRRAERENRPRWEGPPELHVCSCAELADRIEPGSVDTVICDPPYPAEYLDCWYELAKFSERVLKRSGYLVAMSGQIWLPDVMDRLAARLSYKWMGSYATPAATEIWPRMVASQWNIRSLSSGGGR